MNILHTSDLHLGRRLFTKSRYGEMERFFDWMIERIEKERVDCVLMAGDVFDTSTPGNRAQELYYEFLYRMSRSCCRHVVIIAGNHDSPSMLEAPKTLLRSLDIHVVANGNENPESEVLLLRDPEGHPELICCAIPFLQERIVRKSRPGESLEEKRKNLLAGIESHHRRVFEYAQQVLERCDVPVPMLAMGHLYAAGSRVSEDEGVRDLYIGSLGQVPASIFPASLDYVALGHLHAPQKVGGSDVIRYCGSPIPMGFGESMQQKHVILVRIEKNTSGESVGKDRRFTTRVEPIPVPRFQEMRQIRGAWKEIEKRLEELKTCEEPRGITDNGDHGFLSESAPIGSGLSGSSGSSYNARPCWVEIDYIGLEILSDLKERIEKIVSESGIELLRIYNRSLLESKSLHLSGLPGENWVPLSEWSVEETFERCMNVRDIPEQQRTELRETFREILQSEELKGEPPEEISAREGGG